MSIRLILWTMAMAYVGFLGAGVGLILALMFSRRDKRKHQVGLNTLRRH
jgi:hypothetical protein